MRIKELIKSIGRFTATLPLKDFDVKGVSCNSKKVSQGFVFVAIRGTKQDGGQFVEDAVNRGSGLVVTEPPFLRKHSSPKIPVILVKDARLALAKLAARFYGNPSDNVKVVGITGTNGKTTITYLLEQILKKAHLPAGVIGTVNYRYKNKIIPAKNTTPGPLELQSLLADMRKEAIKYCLMEVSSHSIDQKRAEGIDFNSAIFTNLTQDHLDYHGTLENYFQCKALLFKKLRQGAFAAINTDDKYGRRLKEITKTRVITYGIDNDAYVSAKDIKYYPTHTEFLLCAGAKKIKIESGLIGKHNVYNILAACAWSLKSGIPLGLLGPALKEFSGAPGRLERVESKKSFSVFVDYAHTEDALKNIIASLRNLCKNKIIVVFGCGGERDKGKRPKMGRVVSELADYAIITNDNPRSEKPKAIICDIKRGIRRKNYCVIEDRLEAIKKSLSIAGKGDIVLVAGKGHEDYQILGNKILHFDDREVIKRCSRSKN